MAHGLDGCQGPEDRSGDDGARTPDGRRDRRAAARPCAAPWTRCCPARARCASSPQGRRRVLFAARGLERQRRGLRPLPARDARRRAGRPGRRPASPPTTARGSTSPTRWSSACPSPARPSEIVDDPGLGRAPAAPRRWRSPTSRARRWPSTPTWRWSPGPGRSSRCRRPRPTSPSWSRWPSSAPRSRPDPTVLDADARPGARRGRAAARATPRGVDEAVAALRDAAYAVVSGRGLMMGTALETALKLEETCLRPVRGYSYADLRHGPISVVTERHDRGAGGRARRPAAGADGRARRRPRRRAARRVVGIGGDAGVRRRLRRARARARTCPRRWRRSARSCPRS